MNSHNVLVVFTICLHATYGLSIVKRSADFAEEEMQTPLRGLSEEMQMPSRGGGLSEEMQMPSRGGGLSEEMQMPSRGGGLSEEMQMPSRGGGRSEEMMQTPLRGRNAEENFVPLRRMSEELNNDDLALQEMNEAAQDEVPLDMDSPIVPYNRYKIRHLTKTRERDKPKNTRQKYRHRKKRDILADRKVDLTAIFRRARPWWTPKNVPARG
ncbi:hypothetical protein ACHWQZ_G016206 [Mnemiopsis leidyi]